MSDKQTMRVWWIPQVPGKPFYVPVNNFIEGRKVLDILAEYDQFLLENMVRPDYSNAGGLEVFNDGEWTDWYDDDDNDIDNIPGFQGSIRG